MGCLTMTYVRGKFLIGCKRVSVEIDGISEGIIEGGESRTFDLPDGKHLIVFRYSFISMKVDLTLSGNDSFTVSWDRTMGGMRISKEFEGDNFFDRSGWKYYIFFAAMIIISSVVFGMNVGKGIPVEFALTFNIILMIALLISLADIYRKRSRTVVWGEEME